MKILLYPDKQHPKYRVTQLKPYIEETGVEIARDKDDSYDVFLYWSYHKCVRPHDRFIIERSLKEHIINLGGWNCTKTYNEEVMNAVFGYNTIVDPHTYTRPMAEKSEKQGSHDLKIIKHFTEKKKNYIYVKLLDNRINENTVRDFRVFVYGYKVELVLIKDKDIEDRFGGAIKSTITVCDNPLDVFSGDEVNKLERFCVVYDTEFTELDVCRDADGKIYVVDNNNIPSYNPAIKPIFEADNRRLLGFLSDKFYKMLQRYAD